MITIFDWFGYEAPHQKRYELIKQAGFDGVLLYWSDEFGNVDYKHNAELARQEGLFVENIHTSFDNINDLWMDNLSGNEITDYLMQCVDDCNEYEIPTMIVHITSGECPPKANILGINRIRKITERAEQLGVNVALENLRNIENLGKVFDNIHSSRLGFCFDSGHQNYRSKNTDLLSMYGDRLMAIHLHDNDESADQHRMPFDGNINWELVMKKLTHINYKGPTALEIMNMGYEHIKESREFLAIAFERAKRLDALR
ncbi:sugar phosphate isomerase/epimerase family protein [Alloiococcus sp. CFN-8]|uniref:sugar phosphate isomerase/epimerase family protein n=1 Tax=Alloiococcus sp. CFN-8 TaxID=3416081 RepID=UPI003CF81310